MSGWWFGTMEFYGFPYGKNHPNWLILVRGVGIPPIRLVKVTMDFAHNTQYTLKTDPTKWGSFRCFCLCADCFPFGTWIWSWTYSIYPWTCSIYHLKTCFNPFSMFFTRFSMIFSLLTFQRCSHEKNTGLCHDAVNQKNLRSWGTLGLYVASRLGLVGFNVVNVVTLW